MRLDAEVDAAVGQQCIIARRRRACRQTLRNVSVGAGFYAASRQATTLDNFYFTPAFITFDAKIAYETDRWSTALVGKNLADRRCFELFPQGLGGVAPAEPRTVYVVATAKH